jgi:hypothetical protein
MKKVFSNSYDVIHLFAQRTQEEARCSNVFFEDKDRIYSYGHHYLLAEFKTNARNELAVIINDRGYSSTTSGHISTVTGATSQYKQFFTMNIEPSYVLNTLETLANKLQRAKKPGMYISEAERLYAKFHEFQNWYGVSNDIERLEKIESIITVFRGSSYTEYMVKQAEIIKQAEAKKLKEARKRFKIELKEFFEYKRDYIHGRIDEDYIRISSDGWYIETSQRVSVPIKEARVLYQLIKSGHDIKGFNISGYTVIGLNGVLRIGCHKINKKNMAEIGEKIIQG